MKCLWNTNNFFKTSNKPNLPFEYLVSEQGDLSDLHADK